MKSALYVLNILRQLRRIAVALEDANDMSRQRLRYDYPPAGEAPPPRPATISRLSVEEMNQRYEKKLHDRLLRGVK